MYYVYVVQEGDDPTIALVKIGISATPVHRVLNIGFEVPMIQAIFPFATKREARDTEGALHRLLAPYWLGGEYFKLEEDILQHVTKESMCDPFVVSLQGIDHMILSMFQKKSQ